MSRQHVFMQDQVHDRVKEIMTSDPRHPDRRRAGLGAWALILFVGALYSLGVLARV